MPLVVDPFGHYDLHVAQRKSKSVTVCRSQYGILVQGFGVGVWVVKLVVSGEDYWLIHFGFICSLVQFAIFEILCILPQSRESCTHVKKKLNWQLFNAQYWRVAFLLLWKLEWDPNQNLFWIIFFFFFLKKMQPIQYNNLPCIIH